MLLVCSLNISYLFTVHPYASLKAFRMKRVRLLLPCPNCPLPASSTDLLFSLQINIKVIRMCYSVLSLQASSAHEINNAIQDALWLFFQIILKKSSLAKMIVRVTERLVLQG